MLVMRVRSGAPRCCSILLAATTSLAVPGRADAAVFYAAPAAFMDDSLAVPPTRLIAIDESGGVSATIGLVKLGDVDVAVTALALDATGVLYGFIHSQMIGTQLVTIDQDTAAATLVGAGTTLPERVNGAAFDRKGRLWAVTLEDKVLDEFHIPSLSFVGAGFAVPEVDVNGMDVAFDLADNCYYIATYADNSSSPLYSCDVEAMTFTMLGPLIASGFVDNMPATNAATSGLAFSLDNVTCQSTLLGSDGYNKDEIGVIDIENLTITETANLGVNYSHFNWPDMAGFPIVTQTESCDFCGDGLDDPGEECDDGNELSDDGCSASCLLEDADGDGVGDPDDTCPGFDDGLDDDGDARPDACDNCPVDSNADQADEDQDGVGDACEAPAGTTGGTTTSDDTTGATSSAPGSESTDPGSTGDGPSTTAGDDTAGTGVSGTGIDATGGAPTASESGEPDGPTSGAGSESEGSSGNGTATNGELDDEPFGCRVSRDGRGLLMLVGLGLLARRRRTGGSMHNT